MNRRHAMAALLAAIVCTPAVAAEAPPVPIRTGTYLGERPCDTCDRLTYRLDLADDSTFVLRVEAVTGDDRQAMDDVGTWTVTTDPPTLVLDRGGENPREFQVVSDRTLRPLNRQQLPIDADGKDDLHRTTEELPPLEPHLLLRGIYKVTPAGGLLEVCRTGNWMTVLDDAGRGTTLAKRFDAAGVDGSEPALVSVEGRIITRKAEGKAVPLRGFVVDDVFGARPGEGCEYKIRPARLWKTYWTLIRLGGSPVETFPDQRDLHVYFRPDGKVAGSAGCNLFLGSFKASRTSLAIGKLSVTPQTCAHGMEQERTLLRAMTGASHWIVADGFLEIRDAAYRRLATFRAVSP